eukprot:5642073-Alexandrium_andersonii.AAC.1
MVHMSCTAVSCSSQPAAGVNQTAAPDEQRGPHGHAFVESEAAGGQTYTCVEALVPAQEGGQRRWPPAAAEVHEVGRQSACPVPFGPRG